MITVNEIDWLFYKVQKKVSFYILLGLIDGIVGDGAGLNALQLFDGVEAESSGVTEGLTPFIKYLKGTKC